MNGCGPGRSWRWIYIASIHWGHGCWLLVRVESCFWEVYNVLASSMLKSIWDIWFGCSCYSGRTPYIKIISTLFCWQRLVPPVCKIWNRSHSPFQKTRARKISGPRFHSAIIKLLTYWSLTHWRLYHFVSADKAISLDEDRVDSKASSLAVHQRR